MIEDPIKRKLAAAVLAESAERERALGAVSLRDYLACRAPEPPRDFRPLAEYPYLPPQRPPHWDDKTLEKWRGWRDWIDDADIDPKTLEEFEMLSAARTQYDADRELTMMTDYTNRIAKWRYFFADAMIAERNKRSEDDEREKFDAENERERFEME